MKTTAGLCGRPISSRRRRPLAYMMMMMTMYIIPKIPNKIWDYRYDNIA